jgi:hypothetical protein
MVAQIGGKARLPGGLGRRRRVTGDFFHGGTHLVYCGGRLFDFAVLLLQGTVRTFSD